MRGTCWRLLTNVVRAVADVGGDLFHTLVVQHSLLLGEGTGKLLIDSSAGKEMSDITAAMIYENKLTGIMWPKPKHSILKVAHAKDKRGQTLCPNSRDDSCTVLQLDWLQLKPAVDSGLEDLLAFVKSLNGGFPFLMFKTQHS